MIVPLLCFHADSLSFPIFSCCFSSGFAVDIFWCVTLLHHKPSVPLLAARLSASFSLSRGVLPLFLFRISFVLTRFSKVF